MSDLPKRERKQAELYKVEENPPAKSVSIQTGNGTRLSEYPFFLKGLEKMKGDDEIIKSLHSVLFSSVGKKLDAKKNIRLFNGFADEKTKNEKLSRVTENKKKWTVPLLKDCMGLFGMEKTGTRAELVEKLMDYLMSPKVIKEESHGVAKTKKSKAATTKTAAAKGKKRKATNDGKAPKKARAPSAYILFSVDARIEIKKANPDATFAEMGALIGSKWNSIGEVEKKKWTDLAAEKAAAMKVDEENPDEIEGEVEGDDEDDEKDDDEEKDAENEEEEVAVEEESEGEKDAEEHEDKAEPDED